MFASWGSIAYRYRLPVLIVVVLAVLAGGGWGLGVFDRMSTGGYEAPGSEAVRAQDIISDELGSQGDLVVLYEAPAGTTVDDPEIAQRITGALDRIPDDAVTKVTSYWQTGVPQLATPDRTTGLATINLSGSDVGAKMDSYERIEDDLQVAGVRTDVAGEVPMQMSMEDRAKSDLTRAEAVSMPIVLALLVVIFGSVVAAALPVLVGGLAVFGALGLLHLIALFADVNVFSINVASLLGLGLAIDYGLFIVGRFREEMAQNRSTGDALRRTVASAGRTVAFSATLVVIALAGLTLFPQDFLKSLAFGGMSAVALAAVISLTLLPALLGLLGPNVDKLAMPWRGRETNGGGWRRFADGVMKRPLITAVPILALLALLGGPFLGVQFGTPDERMLPADDAARQSIEKLREDFPAMSDNGIDVVVRGDPAPAETQRYTDQISAIPGVQDVTPAGQGEGVLLLNAGLSGDPYGSDSKQAVEDIRGLSPPGNAEVLVGGPTALNADSLDATAEKLPWVAALLIAATLVLMFLAFGSVLLPIKAVVMSALSLSATFGVLTWIFVDGHGADLLGVTPTPMEVGIVVLMASVVFGLSTDYEVFLLSRMVEARANGASTAEAVRTGIARTGRMITAAALLLIVVTGAFAFASVTVMRFVGVGMIFALALDATVVRMVLVPAVLKLMGSASWWAPGPMQRWQQRAGISESEPPELGTVDNSTDPVDNSVSRNTRVIPPITESAQVDGLSNGVAQDAHGPVDNSVDNQPDAWSAPSTTSSDAARGYLHGIVRDSTGVALPAVILTLTDPGGREIEHTRSDSTGRYRIGVGRRGTYLLIASAEHAEPAAARVSLGGEPVRHDVRLSGARVVTGTRVSGVVSAPGAGPVPDARVGLLDATGAVVAMTSTDHDGRYLFTDLPGGRYTVIASGYPPVASSLHLAGGEASHDVELGYPHEGTGAFAVRYSGELETADGESANGERPF